LLDECDVPRNREATQPVSDIALEHLFVKRCAFGADDERGEALPEQGIGNADHRNVGDLRQGGDGFFDRPRKHTLLCIRSRCGTVWPTRLLYDWQVTCCTIVK
jgi:hypothetical protein